MPQYYVKVHCFHPYKIEQEQVVEAATHATAIRRLLAIFRKHPKIKGKKVEEFYAQAKRL